jgi:prevent-host-death family protein
MTCPFIEGAIGICESKKSRERPSSEIQSGGNRRTPNGTTWRDLWLGKLELHLGRKLAILLAMSETVNIAEFKDRFSELIALVEQGHEVIVCRRNVPLARVEPIRKPAPLKPPHRVLGCMKGTVQIHGDLTEPCIPESDWEMLK